MKKAIGVDISKYDQIFYPERSMYPLDFVIQRAGHSYNGIFYEDARFMKYLPEVAKVPIKLSYYYMDSGTTLDIQVEEFLDTVSKAPFEWDGFACDWESAYNVLSESFADKGVQWIEAVKRETGKPVLLYTNNSLYEQYWTLRGKNYPLWISWPLQDGQWTIENIHYKKPNLPEGRPDYKIWQFSFTLNGIDWGTGREHSGDGDIFNGTVEDMKRFLNNEEVEEPMEEKVLVKKSLLDILQKESEEYNKLQKEFAVIYNTITEQGEKLTANVESLVKSAESPEEPVPETKDEWRTLVGLNVRSAPVVSDNKVGSVPAGISVYIVEYSEKTNGDLWGRMDTAGWIALKYQGNEYAERIEQDV